MELNLMDMICGRVSHRIRPVLVMSVKSFDALASSFLRLSCERVFTLKLKSIETTHFFCIYAIDSREFNCLLTGRSLSELSSSLVRAANLNANV